MYSAGSHSTSSGGHPTPWWPRLQVWGQEPDGFGICRSRAMTRPGFGRCFRPDNWTWQNVDVWQDPTEAFPKYFNISISIAWFRDYFRGSVQALLSSPSCMFHFRDFILASKTFYRCKPQKFIEIYCQFHSQETFIPRKLASASSTRCDLAAQDSKSTTLRCCGGITNHGEWISCICSGSWCPRRHIPINYTYRSYQTEVVFFTFIYNLYFVFNQVRSQNTTIHMIHTIGLVLARLQGSGSWKFTSGHQPPGLSRSVAAELRPALAGDRDGGTQKAPRDIATAPEVLWRMVEDWV